MYDQTFQIGNLLFKIEQIKEINQVTVKTLEKLAPLYFALGESQLRHR
ncbi:hypothetical protein GCM10011573_20100 [Enterococcus wangshanyuanii]|uniref:Uncharacterized protein n=1 Tax=Enterococcus wangshanyuanii TaxID=2005703 RepID=A0ABQ1P518_9ENTE|nr:hypothetical protein [Enterococcus wangshanyuanii]GGC90432.1 hypothetical protein GCM10011573_20100 [Enterococcus wangshanyuanii]